MRADATAVPLSSRAKLLSFVALYTSVFAFGISFGGLVPWIALTLEDRGISDMAIGLVSAANPLGVFFVAPLVPRILKRLSAADAMIVAGLISLAGILALAVWSSAASWFVLRLLSGLAGAVAWVVTETWINAIADKHNRGRLVAIYATLMAIGFACGPLIVAAVDRDTLQPLFLFAGLHAAAVAPIVLLRRLSPAIGATHRLAVVPILRAVPLALAAAFLSGALDTSFFTFLPIWGMRSGIGETAAVTLLSVFIAGNIFLQVPIGWLADRYGHRPVMIGCGLMCVAGPPLAYFALDQIVLLAAILFLWGGAGWATYTVGLVMLGERFTGGELTASNAAFVMVYTLANIAGPPVSGLAMTAYDPHGIMVLMFGLAVCFTARAMLQRDAGTPPIRRVEL